MVLASLPAFATNDPVTECLDSLAQNYKELETNVFKQVGTEVESLGGSEPRILDDYYRGKVAGAMESILTNLRSICELKDNSEFKDVTAAAVAAKK